MSIDLSRQSFLGLFGGASVLFARWTVELYLNPQGGGEHIKSHYTYLCEMHLKVISCWLETLALKNTCTSID